MARALVFAHYDRDGLFELYEPSSGLLVRHLRARRCGVGEQLASALAQALQAIEHKVRAIDVAEHDRGGVGVAPEEGVLAFGGEGASSFDEEGLGDVCGDVLDRGGGCACGGGDPVPIELAAGLHLHRSGRLLWLPRVCPCPCHRSRRVKYLPINISRWTACGRRLAGEWPNRNSRCRIFTSPTNTIWRR